MGTPAAADPANPPASDPAPPADRSFTQADIDRIVADRVARERGKYADYDDLKAKAADFEKLRAESQTEQEKAIEAARAEGKAEVQTAANERLIRAEVRAAAAGKLANPELAARLLDVTQFKVDDNGDIDSKQIAAAVDELVKKEPYLAARAFQGTGDGGAAGRQPSNGPAQVTETEYRAMNAGQRVKARKEGRLTQLLGGG